MVVAPYMLQDFEPLHREQEFMRGMLHPRYCNTYLDANALDSGDVVRNALVDRFKRLEESGAIGVAIPHSVHTEVLNPHTPANVQSSMLAEIHTLPTQRTPNEHDTLANIRRILQGNAEPGKHAADAEHLFEASKYGGGCFITHDQRMLKKRDELEPYIAPHKIVLLGEFLRIYDKFAAEEAGDGM